MEEKLKNLFDYQRFEKNTELDALIRQTQSRFARELSDDDLEMVAAAGETAKPDKIDGIDIPKNGGV